MVRVRESYSEPSVILIELRRSVHCTISTSQRPTKITEAVTIVHLLHAVCVLLKAFKRNH